jgi:signal transduction histidine kinase
MAMDTMIASGVPGLGDVAWGTHFCHFYDSRDDLVDTLVPFFKMGLDNREACLWVASEPFGAADARAALGAVVPDLAERERRGQIEIIDHRDWYRCHEGADAQRTLAGWVEREQAALRGGYTGLRLTGNTYWLERKDWDSFVHYESMVNEVFRHHRILGLCSYCFQRCSARDVLDVVKNHQFTLARRAGEWEIMDGSAMRLAREDLLRVQRAAEELRELDERKDRFLAMISHELRNPVAPIRTAVQVMRLRGGGEQFGKELDVIERQVQHLASLVDDLLDVAGVGRGELELRRELIDFADVVARGIDVMRPLIERGQHELMVDVPPGLALLGDPDRLSQMVARLVSNAARHGGAGQRIAITGERADDHARLRVTDSGPGIPPELLPRIFELFVQGDRVLDRGHGGLGVGLPIVKAIAELHGGSVEVESTPAGSTFLVRLPLHRAAGPGRSATAERRVLVVDDNEDAADALAEALGDLGYEARAAHDGPSALALAAELAPAYALIDIGLPGMSGYELGQELRALLGPGVVLIALTGHGQERDRQRTREQGFHEHLVKPVKLEAVLRSLSAEVS